MLSTYIRLKTKFNVELYFYMLDVAIFQFYNICNLKYVLKDIIKNCTYLQLVLSENEDVSKSDIIATEMTDDELAAISDL